MFLLILLRVQPSKRLTNPTKQETHQSDEQFNQSYNRGGGRMNRGRGGRANRGGRGRGRGPRPTCQLCYKYGHDAFYCWNRFDQDFVQPPPPTDETQSAQISGSFQGPQPPPNQNQPRAYFAAQQNSYAPATQEFQVPTDSQV